jgi:predicted dehydrogenase
VTDTLGWGIVGCGWVARDYVAPGLAAAPSARLLALCDPDAGAMRRIAEAAPGAACFTDLDEFLAAPGLDAVYVATPNHRHRPLTEAAARAGKHVLCEKPMATTVEDAEAMTAACDRAGVRYGTAFDQRFQARHRRLKDLVMRGDLGTVTAARIHYACWTPGDWVPPGQDAHDNWRVDPARAGGGAFIDLAPHGLDLLQWLLGEPLVEVACLLQRRVHPYPVDDGAALVGRFASGALLSMNVAYNCPDAFPRRTLELIGTGAMAVAQNTMGQTPGGALTIIDARTGRGEEIGVPAGEDVSPFQAQVEAFSRCILDGVPFPFPPARDLHTMRLLHAAQAHAGGVRVDPA